MEVNPHLIQRNFQALNGAIDGIRGTMDKLASDIKSKDAIIYQQSQKIAIMEQKVNIMFAKSMNEGRIA